MREIEFTIDAATGELTIHIKGIAGPGCSDIARLASELLGTECAVDFWKRGRQGGRWDVE